MGGSKLVEFYGIVCYIYLHSTSVSLSTRVLIQCPLWCNQLLREVSFLQGHSALCWRLELCTLEGGSQSTSQLIMYLYCILPNNPLSKASPVLGLG